MKTLILSPHIDDCEACMGGTIKRLTESGKNIKVLFYSTCDLDQGYAEVRNSMEALGVGKGHYYILNYMRRTFTHFRGEILQHLVEEKNVDTVYCPSPDDFHQDHAVIGQEAVRAFGGRVNLLFYLWPRNMRYIQPSVFCELNDEHLEAKMESLRSYRSQIQMRPEYFNEDYFKSAAVLWGSLCGVKYAEAFEPYRIKLNV